MFVDAVWPQRLVFNRVKQRFVVVSPNNVSGGVGDGILKQLTGSKVFNENGVFPAAYCIGAVGQQFVVFAYRETADVEIGKSFGHFVAIEQDFFFSTLFLFFPNPNRMFFAFVIALHIPVAIQIIRHRLIGRLDAPGDFLKQRILKVFGIFKLCFGVGIFGFEIFNHFRIFALVEPVIIIHTRITVDGQFFRFLLCFRCFHSLLILAV